MRLREPTIFVLTSGHDFSIIWITLAASLRLVVAWLGQEQTCSGNACVLAKAATSLSSIYARGRIKVSSPLKRTCLGFIPEISELKNIFIRMVSAISSLWWPKATLLQLSAFAVSKTAFRLFHEHQKQLISLRDLQPPSKISTVTILYS